MIKIIEPGTKPWPNAIAAVVSSLMRKKIFRVVHTRHLMDVRAKYYKNFQNYLSIMYCAHSVERILRLFQLKCREHKEE